MLVTIRQQCVRLAAAGLLCSAWAVTPAAGNSDRQIVDAAKDRDWATVGILLDRGVDSDTRQGDGATALHWAAHWNDLPTVDRLIDAGANLDAANDLGATPLWVACASRNTGSCNGCWPPGPVRTAGFVPVRRYSCVARRRATPWRSRRCSNTAPTSTPPSRRTGRPP